MAKEHKKFTILFTILTTLALSHQLHMEASFFNSKMEFTEKVSALLKDPETRNLWTQFHEKKYLDSNAINLMINNVTKPESDFDFKDTKTWGKVSFEMPFSDQVSGYDRVIFYFNKTAPTPNMFAYIKLPIPASHAKLPPEVNPGVFGVAPYTPAAMTYGKVFPTELGGKWPAYFFGPDKKIMLISTEKGYLSGPEEMYRFFVSASWVNLVSGPGLELAKYKQGPIVPTPAYFRSQEDADAWKINENKMTKLNYEIKDWDYPQAEISGCGERLHELKEALGLIKAKIDALE